MEDITDPSELVWLWSDRGGHAVDIRASKPPLLVVVVVVEPHPHARRHRALHGAIGPLEDENDVSVAEPPTVELDRRHDGVKVHLCARHQLPLPIRKLGAGAHSHQGRLATKYDRRALEKLIANAYPPVLPR